MTFDEYQQTINEDKMPSGLGNPLAALWHDARGDWDRAHDFAQRDDDSASALVHAYLHRKENDLMNANYWYVRAGRTLPEERLDKEWEEIAKALLKKAY